jgi:hypothetical protein
MIFVSLMTPPIILSMNATDLKISRLLGLTYEEYEELEHTNLRCITDYNRTIIHYYIIVSKSNPAHILSKLKMNKLGMIYFSPECFDIKDLPKDEQLY